MCYHPPMWYMVGGFILLAVILVFLYGLIACIVEYLWKDHKAALRERHERYCPTCHQRADTVNLASYFPNTQTVDYRCRNGHKWAGFVRAETQLATGFGVDSYAP